MVLLFERNDITKLEVDAIVNAANSSLLGGSGVDGAIHYAAGPELLEECRTLGGCETGKAKITKGYNLPAKYVIHTVGPIYNDGKHNEKELLESCYKNSLLIAKEKNLESIAFPLISSGVFGYPKDEAFNVAVETIKNFFTGENAEIDMTVYIVLYGKTTININKDKIVDLQEYIDDNYVAEQKAKFPENNSQMRKFGSVGNTFANIGSVCINEYSDKDDLCIKKINKFDLEEDFDEVILDEKIKKSGIKKETNGSEDIKKDVEELPQIKLSSQNNKNGKISSDIKEIIISDENFIDSLFKLIDKKGLKDSDVYNKANIDRKLFSKIRNGSHPKKSTAISLCIALKLDINETKVLLMKAGYAFSDASYFDVIIKYHIENKIYEITEINKVLLNYDQPQLGEVR